MAFDAFTRFPRAFSGRPALARRVYDAMRRSLGPSFNQSFDDSRVQARLYAQAMGIANALRTLERVKKNAIALSSTDLLSNLESMYGIIPKPGSTFRERRNRLHARMQLLRGSRYEAIQDIMRSILGNDFLEWSFATVDTLVRFPDTSAEAALVGNYVPPGTQARILRVLAPILPGTRTVAVEELTPPLDGAPPPVGMTFLADPAHKVRREASRIDDSEITEDGKITSVTADFVNPHDEGVLLTTQHFPTWRSNAHRHVFVVSESAAVDLERRRAVGEELSRAMKSVAMWHIVDPNEFTVGEGLLGITPLGESA